MQAQTLLISWVHWSILHRNVNEDEWGLVFIYIYISYDVTLLYWNIDEFKVDCVKNVWTSQMFHFFRGFQRSHGLGHGGCWNERAASRPLGSWKMPSLESRAEHLPSSKLTLTMENHHVWYEIHLQMVFCVFSVVILVVGGENHASGKQAASDHKCSCISHAVFLTNVSSQWVRWMLEAPRILLLAAIAWLMHNPESWCGFNCVCLEDIFGQ